MLPVRSLLGLFTRRRSTSVRSPYGAPVRAIIAPAACGGFLLFIDYVQRQIAADMELGIRYDEYEVPNAAEFAAADRGLADLGLTRTEPWRPDGRPGKFVASLASTQPTPLACPETTVRSEDYR